MGAGQQQDRVRGRGLHRTPLEAQLRATSCCCCEAGGWGEMNLPGLLVAAMMKTCRRVSRPSISVSSWLTTRTLAPD